MAPLVSSSSSSATKPTHFLARMRRFLQPQFSTRKRPSPSDDRLQRPRRSGSEGEGVVSTIDSDDEPVVLLRKTVKKLHFGSTEEKEAAGMDVERLAREDPKARKLMGDLGVVQALVSMAASEVQSRRSVAVRALIELAHGTYTNKILMVEAGLWQNLPRNIETIDESIRHDFAKLLLSLSSLANRRYPVRFDSLSFLIKIINSDSSIETKNTCLATLYNLSILLENAGSLVSNGVVHILLKLISTKELAEKGLATLSLVVVTSMGKKTMEDDPMVPSSLMEILTWEDKPKCQELSAYILMVLAYQSSKQCEKMAKLGIVALLLELALLGSALAQKRAMKLLQWFKDERQVKVASHSGPQIARVSTMGSPMSPRTSQEGRRMMKNLVKQSLHKNMEIIIQRASSGANESSKLKSLVISTSSKSLPY